jgi:hypothetical protein
MLVVFASFAISQISQCAFWEMANQLSSFCPMAKVSASFLRGYLPSCNQTIPEMEILKLPSSKLDEGCFWIFGEPAPM